MKLMSEEQIDAWAVTFRQVFNPKMADALMDLCAQAKLANCPAVEVEARLREAAEFFRDRCLPHPETADWLKHSEALALVPKPAEVKREGWQRAAQEAAELMEAMQRDWVQGNFTPHKASIAIREYKQRLAAIDKGDK